MCHVYIVSIRISSEQFSILPDKYDLTTTLPATWADKTCPCGLINKFTYSNTSRNSSFRRYLIPSRRQPICPVTWDVIWACSSFVADLIPCCVMNVFSTPVSVFCGYPKSRISTHPNEIENKLLMLSIALAVKPKIKKSN